MSNILKIKVDNEYTLSKTPMYYDYVAMAYCPKCGDDTKVMIKALSQRNLIDFVHKQISKCPTCNGPIFTKQGYHSCGSMYSASAYDLEKKYMAAEKEKSRTSVLKAQTKAKTFADLAQDNPLATEIKKDVEKVKDYIQSLIELEFGAAHLVEKIIGLDVKRKENNQVEYRSQGNALKQKEEQRDKIKKEIEKKQEKFKKTDWKSLVEVQTFEKPLPPNMRLIPNAVKPKQPLLKTPNFFNKKKILAENERLIKEYEDAMAKYEKTMEIRQENMRINNEKTQQYEKAIAEYNSNIAQAKIDTKEKIQKKKAAAQIKLDKEVEKLMLELAELDKPEETLKIDDPIEKELTAEKNKCQKFLAKTREAINEALSLNVIHSKYRNLQAFASIYEYLDTGRCYQLEGPDGAYNLYESERHSDAASKLLCGLEDFLNYEGIVQCVVNEMKKMTDEQICEKIEKNMKLWKVKK